MIFDKMKLILVMILCCFAVISSTLGQTGGKYTEDGVDVTELTTQGQAAAKPEAGDKPESELKPATMDANASPATIFDELPFPGKVSEGKLVIPVKVKASDKSLYYPVVSMPIDGAIPEGEPQIRQTDQQGEMLNHCIGQLLVFPETFGSNKKRSILYWLIPGQIGQKDEKYFQAVWPGKPSLEENKMQKALPFEGLTVSKKGQLWSVRNRFFEIQHNMLQAGKIEEVLFRHTGKVVPVKMNDNLDSSWTMVADPEASASLILPGGATGEQDGVLLAAAIECPVLFKNKMGSDQPAIRALYRYIYTADSPWVKVEIYFPLQVVPKRIYKINLLSFSSEPKAIFWKEDIDGVLIDDENNHAFGVNSPATRGAIELEDNKKRDREKKQRLDRIEKQNLDGINFTGRNDGRAQPWTGEAFSTVAYLYAGPADAIRSGRQRPNLQVFAGRSEYVKRIRDLSSQAETAGNPLIERTVQMLCKAAAMRVADEHDLESAVELMNLADKLLSEKKQSGVIAMKTASFIVFTNSQTGFLFRHTDKSFGLDGIFHMEKNHSFLSCDYPNNAFWRSRYRRHGDKELWCESDSLNARQIECELIQKDNQTVLKISAASQLTDGSDVSTIVTGTIDEKDPLIKWRIKVTPKSDQMALWEVDFPVVAGIRPESFNSEPDYLATPYKTGLLAKDPVHYKIGEGGQLYPGDAGWQYLPYWQGEAGLYFACHDGNGNMKRFRPFSTGDGTFQLRITHMPAGMDEVGTTFDMPYDCILGAFTGDWYDASQIYRKFLVAQEWFPKKTLYENEEIPKWFKEASLCIRMWSYGKDAVLAASDAIELAKKIGTPATIVWYGWSESKPVHNSQVPEKFAPENFRQAVALMENNGIHVFPYTVTMLWDTRNESYKQRGGEKAAVRDYDGKILMASYGGNPLAATSPTSPEFCKLLMEVIDGIGNAADVSGVYFDLGGTAASGGHWRAAGERMGGNGRTIGMREQIRNVRNTGRKKNPEFVVWMEGNGDCYTGTVDSYLMFTSDLPIRQVLYADYCRPFGSKNSEWSPPPQELWYSAREFAWGGPVGRITVGLTLKLDGKGPEMERKRQYFQRLFNYRMAALPWLAYGRMLRPLKIEQMTPPDPEELSYLNGATLPQAVWKAPDGTVALVFVNARYSSPAVEFSYEFDPKEYDVPADGTWGLYKLTPGQDNKAQFEKLNDIYGVLKRTEVLPAEEPLILVARPLAPAYFVHSFDKMEGIEILRPKSVVMTDCQLENKEQDVLRLAWENKADQNRGMMSLRINTPAINISSGTLTVKMKSLKNQGKPIDVNLIAYDAVNNLIFETNAGSISRDDQWSTLSIDLGSVLKKALSSPEKKENQIGDWRRPAFWDIIMYTYDTNSVNTVLIDEFSLR